MIFFLIIYGLFPAISQSLNNEKVNQPDLYTYILKKSGLDHELINGIQYYNRYHRVLSHPYYNGEKPFPGTVILSGKIFNNVLINYDIYSQYLILEYQDIDQGIYKVILNPQHTDAFELDGNYFEKLILDEQVPLFYQVIRVNDLTCYIHWKKELQVKIKNLQYTEYFTVSERTYFLDLDGERFQFTNRKNLASLISGISEKQIRSYMRKNAFNFKTMTLKELIGLFEFISLSVSSTSGN